MMIAQQTPMVRPQRSMARRREAGSRSARRTGVEATRSLRFTRVRERQSEGGSPVSPEGGSPGSIAQDANETGALGGVCGGARPVMRPQYQRPRLLREIPDRSRPTWSCGISQSDDTPGSLCVRTEGLRGYRSSPSKAGCHSTSQSSTPRTRSCRCAIRHPSGRRTTESW